MPNDEEENYNHKSKSENFKNKSEIKKDTIYPEQLKIIDLEKNGVISKQSDSIQKLLKSPKKKQR
ncbi:MAG: hypothetical protein U0T80_08950 [Flavobacteriaceae bacterium]